MHLSRCPRCAREIPTSNVDLQVGTATCQPCDTVHPLLETLEPLPQREPPQEPIPEELMRLARSPKGLFIEVNNEVLTIRRRWWSWSAQNLYGLGFIVVWDGFLFVWYYVQFGMLSSDFFSGMMASITWIVPLVFPIAHLLMGVVYTYGMACVVLNSSTLTVDGDDLSVKHGPLGPFAGIETPRFLIKQIYVTERGAVRPKKRRSLFQRPSLGRFDVVVRYHSGKNQVLLEGLPRFEQAVFIEHRLEAFLGIANQRVEGEVED